MLRDTATTRHGELRGLRLDGVVLFAGVPYATTPTSGPQRFSMPAPVEAWRGVREATAFGPVAPQPNAMPGFLPGESPEQDEECRTLNIWVGEGPAERLPVLVFVHGGAFLTGAGSSLLYRGEHLARRGVVVVTFNYRLGVLGFLAHDALGDGSAPFRGNWGLADQLAALHYVRDNIAAFGGDPDNVTVFGESAGAMSICDLLGMPAAKGLFKRAIIESGAALARPLSVAAPLAERFAGLLGVASLRDATLDSVPLEELLGAQAVLVEEVDEGLGMPFAPVVDGGLVREHPATVLAAGRGATGTEVLAGTNRDEFRFFSFLSLSRSSEELDSAHLEEIVRSYLHSAGLTKGPAPSEVLELYATLRHERGESSAPRDVLDAFGTDWIFRIPQLRLLEAHARHGAAVYSYLFEWSSPFAGGALGSCHALELPFVFGSLHEPLVSLFTGAGDDASRLSEQMQAAWTAFARTGSPSSGALSPWPPYEPEMRSTMLLGSEPRLVTAPGEPERVFWDRHLGRYGVSGPIEGAEPTGVAFLDVLEDRPDNPSGT